MMNKNIFFIFGSPRSATTAFANILDFADNAKVFIEQQPKMGYESREKYEGHFDDSKSFIFSSKNEHILNVHHKNLHYGDKNQNYLVFIEDIIKAWPNAKLLFLYRDGRDVVRSLMNWKNDSKRNNKIFNMKEDNFNSNKIYPVQDLWDYSRIRPKKGESYYEGWKEMNEFEKICWYWASYNEIALNSLEVLDRNRYLMLNMSDNNLIENIENAYKFLDLLGFDKVKIQSLLQSKINRTPYNSYIFPIYDEWNKSHKEVFSYYCNDIMNKLNLW